MDRYKLSYIIESDNIEPLKSFILESFGEYGAKILEIQEQKVRTPGRPRNPNPKIDVWLEKRTKPFSCKVFAQYLGVPYVNAYKKLERMQKMGLIERSGKRGGMVTYRVKRPD